MGSVHRYFFLLFFLPAVCWAQREYTFSGYLKSLEDTTSVPYAHVKGRTPKAFVITNEDGYFSLPVSLGDTVLISAVQFHPRIIPITQPPAQVPQTIWMQVRIYEVPAIIVYPRHIMRGFFSHKRIDYDRHRPQELRFPKPSISFGGPSSYANDELRLLVIDGLLSSLLQPFNSEYQQMKKLYAERQRQRLERYYQNLITERLTPDFVQQYVPLREDELPKFFDFWRPEALMLETASNYELILSLQTAKTRYLEHLNHSQSYKSYEQRTTTLALRELLDDPLSGKPQAPLLPASPPPSPPLLSPQGTPPDSLEHSLPRVSEEKLPKKP